MPKTSFLMNRIPRYFILQMNPYEHICLHAAHSFSSNVQHHIKVSAVESCQHIRHLFRDLCRERLRDAIYDSTFDYDVWGTVDVLHVLDHTLLQSFGHVHPLQKRLHQPETTSTKSYVSSSPTQPSVKSCVEYWQKAVVYSNCV